MFARLKEHNQNLRYYENIEGGHSGAANNKQAAYLQSLGYAFLIKHLWTDLLDMRRRIQCLPYVSIALQLRVSHTITLAATLLAFATGCATSSFPTRLGVQEHEPHEFMFVSADGKKEWYSALEFDRIARRYAQEQQLPFDFQATERMVWVNTGGGRVLADVYYSSALGKPMLHIAINRHGQAIHYHIGTAVCGTGSR